MRNQGYISSILTNEEFYVFDKIKVYAAEVISPADFSQIIDLDEFIETEGWYPEDILIEDPEATFYKIDINGMSLAGIHYSANDLVFSDNNIKTIILFGDNLVKNKQELEQDSISWLLHPEKSTFVFPKNGFESVDHVISNNEFKVIVGEKGIRYQLLSDGIVVSAMQVINGVIENRYTARNYRLKGYSNTLIKMVKEYEHILMHSHIQTEAGFQSSMNTGLEKRTA